MSYYLNAKQSTAQTESDLAETFDKWGVRDWEARYNVMRSRHWNKGLSQQEREVTVVWIDPKTKRQVSLSMNKQRTPADNLRVLYLGVEALRMNEKRGIDETVKAAYLQLEAGSDHWTNVLSLPHSASKQEVESSFKRLAKSAHPDAGGTDEEMAVLNKARDAALRAIGGLE